MLNKYLYKKSPYLFFIRFLLSFLILYLFFPFYQGVTGLGGKIYSPFLDSHLNIIKGLAHFLTGSAGLILKALNYSVHQRNYHTLQIGYSGAVRVNPSCLGWGVMSFWIAFVFANNGSWKHKAKWMLAGIAAVCLLNIIRIALILLAIHLRWRLITSLDQHQTFNIFSYGCIFLFVFWYMRNQKKYEMIKSREIVNSLGSSP